MWDSGNGIWSATRHGKIERWGNLENAWSGAPHIHHVNGDHSDNDPNNLTFVCQSCHRELHRSNDATDFAKKYWISKDVS